MSNTIEITTGLAEITTESEAQIIMDELRTIWGIMISGSTTVLVTRSADECLSLYRWIFMSHQHAVSLCAYFWHRPEMDTSKLSQARYLASAFSALLETQFPIITKKFKADLNETEMLEILNGKMAVQYANRILGPDTEEYLDYATA